MKQGRTIDVHVPEFALDALKQHCIQQLEAKLKAGECW
jgi:hypothetical protein